jgi:hypothetical protein
MWLRSSAQIDVHPRADEPIDRGGRHVYYVIEPR